MKLPTIDSPTYTLTIPSTGKKVEFRPFVVKEEKTLLIAQETGKEVDIINTIGNIVQNCTFGKVDKNDLSSFDLEYIFLKLRAKSVSETAEFEIKCGDCETFNDVVVNLEDVEMTEFTPLPDKIMITESVGVVPRFISAEKLAEIRDSVEHSADLVVRVVAASIKSIFDERTVYEASNMEESDLVEFIEGLTHEQLSNIEKVVSDIPQLEHTVKIKCKKCGKEIEDTLQGLNSFF